MVCAGERMVCEGDGMVCEGDWMVRNEDTIYYTPYGRCISEKGRTNLL